MPQRKVNYEDSCLNQLEHYEPARTYMVPGVEEQQIAYIRKLLLLLLIVLLLLCCCYNVATLQPYGECLALLWRVFKRVDSMRVWDREEVTTTSCLNCNSYR